MEDHVYKNDTFIKLFLLIRVIIGEEKSVFRWIFIEMESNNYLLKSEFSVFILFMLLNGTNVILLLMLFWSNTKA